MRPTAPTLHAAAASIIVAISASEGRAADVLPDIPRGSIAIHLNEIARGLAAPDYAISAPGDASRLFVVEQNGLLRVIENGNLVPAPALDLRSRVSPPLVPSNANDERGFLGLAFHPGFASPTSPGFRTLYTYTSELVSSGASPTYGVPNNAMQNYMNVVSEWKMSASNPAQVDPGSRREVISFGKNAANHNGGTIAFNPTRPNEPYLYIALGDGGNARDVGPGHLEPGGTAQNLTTPMGKMLRFDPLNPALTAGSPDPVSGNGQYRVPLDNPFVGGSPVPEIYAYGFRNPYRFAFDRATGQLILADVGQGTVEEVNRVERGGNYGWAIKEGDFLFDRTTGEVIARSPGQPAGLIDPITGTVATVEYDHGDGISITGGFVYRGTAIPELYGKYVFGDLALTNLPPRVDGRLFYADLDTGEIKDFLLPQFAAGSLPDGLTVHGFGEDAAGELYALVTNTPSNGTGGIVFQLAPVPEPSTYLLFGAGLVLVLTFRSRARHGAC